ncbi:hypothetical protein [Chitinophaga agri]|uniref:Uncharacterized protein n=1 Tax=Chitinophaga agri TaxID=2703787 RepID=A0A6B9ZGI4_9BACT|nr:hypothetical protein [Chitinophaga agri]QHS61166.1 hypothetical protein GWR21_16645 [Chitinophaga agri]
MAKQNSLITFTGKLGNIIGYCRDGQYYLRSMPEKVRQTNATRQAAKRFGIASKQAALIRRAVGPDLDIPCDGNHVNRLNRAFLLAGIGNTKGITGFRFNQHTGIEQFLPVAPRFTRDGVLHIPAQTMPQYRQFTALEVKVIATRVDFASRRIIGVDAAMTVIPAMGVFTGTTLSVEVPGNGMLVVIVQIRALNGDVPTNNRHYQAADIIAVLEPQTKQVYHSQKHSAYLTSAPAIYDVVASTYPHSPDSYIQRE